MRAKTERIAKNLAMYAESMIRTAEIHEADKVIGARRRYRVPHLEGTQDTGFLDEHETQSRGNLVASKLQGSGRHMPTLDLDLEHAYVPSSNEGHGHLYLNVSLPWWKYRILLKVLAWCHIIQPGYYRWSVKRGASFLRAPGVDKTILPDGPSKINESMS